MSDHLRSPGRTRTPAWSPWRMVLSLGVVSLAADMVYEGARSVTGPFLLSLGASAALVGLVTGAGEALALGLRLVTGPWADRSSSYWPLTIAGYALTAVAVPLLAVAAAVHGAGAATLGLGLAVVLVLLERLGKAIRSPAKSALLAEAAGAVGRGRGFGVHKALDQVGAFAGPLLVAGVALVAGSTAPAFVALAVPGALALVLLAVTRRAVPEPAAYAEVGAAPVRSSGETASPVRGLVRLPREFHLAALACALMTLGLATWGVLAVHLVDARLVGVALVPVVYAGAMAVEAVGALGTGWGYDLRGTRVLLVVPPLVASVPALAFAGALSVVLVGLAVWGLATGVLDSTVKAFVADVAPAGRLGAAYGWLAAWQGVAALVGGTLAGSLYAADRVGVWVVVVVLAEAAALALLWWLTGAGRARATGPGPEA